MLPQARDLASGSFVPSNPSIVGCPPRGWVALSLACEQFWGRAVQASCDSLDPGRFLFVQIPKRTPSFHFWPIALADMRLQTKDYLPRSSENIGTASLFPDDKLR